MSDRNIYNENAYKKFADEFHRVIQGPNIRKVDLKWLEPRAKDAGIRTIYGSFGWRSAIQPYCS
jgi:phosphoenolpyruvate carboxykinase (ATP)